MKLPISRNMIPALILLVIVVVLELFAPKPIDWTPNFNKDDQRPYGDKILFELMGKDLFPQQEIEVRSVPVYNYPEEENLIRKKNYIYITNNLALTPWDGKKLLHIAEEGNQVFIAANFIGKFLADTLQLKIEDNIHWKDIAKIKEQTQHFERPELNIKETYLYKKGHGRSLISAFPKENAVVLGRDDKKNIQFIKIPVGKGNIFYHCQPLAFTNYNLLVDNNAELVYKAFSYLPRQTTIWDEYYKPLSQGVTQSPLTYILSSPSMKLAYYLLIICLILFMYFNGKRKQRSIPIITPLRNSSLDFIHTVGRLYYNRKNHKNIAQKKFLHLKEYLRSKYHIEYHGEKEKYLHQLSLRSGISERTLSLLFNQAEELFKKEKINDEELENFHAKIEYIYENCQ